MTNTDLPRITDARTTRRRLIQGAGLVAATMLPASQMHAAPAPGSSKTFVLVHGAWHGGWCWRPVVDLLRREGHTVYAPTLTGCGERLHLATAETNLQTHVNDILAMLHFEDISDMVLVGHSYAGIVISQVASEAAERVRSLIYLDAFLPAPGQSFADLIGQDLPTNPNLAGLPPMLTVEDLGIVEPKLQDFVNDRLTPHPLGALQQGVKFNPATLSAIPRAFIQSSDLFTAEADKAASLDFYVGRMNDAGHDIMLTHPAQLVQMILDMTARGDHAD